MPFRLARQNDLPAIAIIFDAAFFDEEFMGALMHPYRHNYPQDFRRYWKEKVIEWYWDYSHQLVVTYTIKQTAGGEEEVVTGVGDWIRHGKGWETYWGLWGKWDPRNMISNLIIVSHYTALYWRPNRAADISIHRAVSESNRYTRHFWTGERATGWYLNFLAVDPVCQKQGYGRILASWGVERAKRERVTASVISGTGLERFYQRCGFDVQTEQIFEQEGNPLKGKTEGGYVLFCDPKAE